MEIKKIALVLLVFVLIFSSGCLQSSRAPNPQLCEKVALQQNKDNCYHSVALANGDETLCAKIVDLNEKDQCYIDSAVGRTQYFPD